MALLEGRVQRCSVLGTSLFAGGLSEAADLVIDRALSGEGGYATLTGVHGVTVAHREHSERAALDGAWMNFPDGWPLAWRQRQAGCPSAERVGGPDLMPLVLDRGREHDLRHYLFGSTDAVLAGLRANLAESFPGAEICGELSPPFRQLTAADDQAIQEELRESSPHIIWVGLGAPKQDLWCYRNADALRPALCVAVGAAFDFLSGNKHRAPVWMQRSGLEWAHRLANEPRKLAPRYLQSNSRFVVHSVSEMLRGSRR